MAASDIVIVTKNTSQVYSQGGTTIASTSPVSRLLSVLEVDTNFINLKQGLVDLEYSSATKNSPTFTGTPTAPTAGPGTSNNQIATTSFVGAAVSAAVNPIDNIVNSVSIGNQVLNNTLTLKANLSGGANFSGSIRITGAQSPTILGDSQHVVTSGALTYKLQNLDVDIIPDVGNTRDIGTSANYVRRIYANQILPGGTGSTVGTATQPFDEGHFANNTLFIGSASLSQGAAGGIVLPENSSFGDEDSVIPRNLISTELDKAFGDISGGPKRAIKLTLVANGTISSGNPLILNSNGTVSEISSTNLSFIGFASSSATNGNNVDVIVAGPVTGLSGLAAGSEVLISSSGTLKFSRTLTSDIKVGTATSATELFLYSTSTLDLYALGKSKAELADFSVSTASAGTNGLTYDSATGVFEFTPVDLSTFATQAYVDTEIANLVNSAPTSLDTLDELAAALNDDANFASTVTNNIATKAPLASPALTGTPTAPTASASTNTTQIATTAFVQGEISSKIDLNDLSVSTGAASSGGALSYNNSTGQFTFTPADLSNTGNASLNSFSVTTNSPSGSGALSYNNSTGQFTFTPAATFNGAFSSLTGTPTTISGYGITDSIAYTNADIDIGSNDFITTGQIYYSNVFAQTSNLPNASTYHGMFAHVHGTGKGYFAHAGNWVELANASTTLAGYGITDGVSATTHTTDLAAKADLANPTFTGTPAAPTASSGTNTTQLATTAFVQQELTSAGSYNNTSVDTHLNTGTANSGEVLSWNGSDYDWVAQSGGGGGGASVTTSDAAPSSPSAGDLWYNTSAGGLFVYYQDANSSQWVEVVGKTGATGPTNVSIADVAPTNPSTGQFWWNSSTNKLYIYYTDANSSQWVQATTPGAASTVAGPQGPTGPTGPAGTAAITRYANVAAFPASPTAADLAYANDTNTVYVYDGSSWDRISSGSDESPRVTTEPATEHSLNSDGTTSTVTMVAEDPEGFDIEYGIKYNTSGGALPDQLASATTINQSTGVFTFTPSTTNSDAGSFNARLTASDGNRVTVRTIPFSLTFYPQLANVVGRYEFFNTSSYNRSASTTALNDISGNNRHITISNPGAYSSDGFLTHTAGSTSMNFGANSDQKSWAVIFRVPSGWTRSVTWDNNSADAVYYGALEDGNGGGGTPYSGYTTAWSGETIADYVNGTNPSGNRITAWNALTTGSTNSQITTGLQMANTNMHYHAYPNYAVTNEVYAIVFWDVVLTAAEVEEVHNYYRGLLGNANMAAWST